MNSQERYSFMTDTKLTSTQKIILSNYFQKHITSIGSIARGINWPYEQVMSYAALLCRMGYLDRVDRGEYALSSKYKTLLGMTPPIGNCETVASTVPPISKTSVVSMEATPKKPRAKRGSLLEAVMVFSKEGLSIPEIAKKIGASDKCLYLARRSLLEKGKLKASEVIKGGGEIEKMVYSLTREGLSPKEISKKTGLSSLAVHNALGRLRKSGKLQRPKANEAKVLPLETKPLPVAPPKSSEMNPVLMDFFFDLLSKKDGENKVVVNYELYFFSESPKDPVFETLRVHKMLRELSQKGLIEWDAKTHTVHFTDDVLEKIA